MKLLKLIRNILLFAAAFFLIERFCRLQTEGFSIAKIIPPNPLKCQEATCPPEILKALNQPYYFLGSGVQCYAFLSEDKQTVLKFFKHYHLFPSNGLLKKIPLPNLLKPYQQEILRMREERLQKIFKSCQIVYDNLQEETGTLFLHFNKSDCHSVKIVDKLGIAYWLNLSEMEFVLQKKAETISSRFDRLFQAKNERAIEESMEKLKKLYLSCAQKGFKTKDSKIRNYAFIGDEAVAIDIGSFKKIKNLNPWVIEKGQKKFERKLEIWRAEFEKNL
ncbi:MAG TPA: hypothetical protein VLG76_01890 [Rhabdochlamydiaceae bacterium]|nr:hypothetical protein [Rhabdochlamydiaceae bacterium]